MLDYNKTIENLTREQKIAMLSNASMSLDGVDPVTFASFDGANEDVRFPSFKALTRSWNKELAYSIASARAEQAKAEGKNALVLDKSLSMCNPYQGGLSEDPFLAGRMGNMFAAGTRNVTGAISVCSAGVDPMQKAYLDDKVDFGTAYKFFVEPLMTTLKGGNESVILCESVSDYSGLMRSAIESARKSGIVIRRGLDAKQTLDAALRGEVVFGGRDSELRKVLEQYDELSQQIVSGRKTEADLAAAVNEKRALNENAFHLALENTLKLIDFCNQDKFVAQQANAQTQFANTKGIARRACIESTVLLKNENNILPIARTKKVALLGMDAEKQIGNQSFYTAFEDYCTANGVMFLGYSPALDDENEFDDRAKTLCASADVVVCAFEKDENNHSTFKLPFDRQKLAKKIADYSSNTVAIVFSDSPIDMSFDKAFAAVLFAPQDGEFLFESVLDVAFGNAIPSGKLAFTLHDRADEYFSDRRRAKAYRKIGSFVGYRYYDTAGEDVKYPFGYGLSYTNFEYSSLVVKDGEVLFSVKNVGNMSGFETVQIYVGRADKNLPYAKKELIGFAKVFLNPDESKTVKIKIESIATYDETTNSFIKEGGKHTVYVCSNVSDVRLRTNITIKGAQAHKHTDKLSDYIPLATDENNNEYRFDGVSRKKKNVEGILIALLAMLVGIASDVVLYLKKDSFDKVIFWVIVALANLIVLIGFVGLIASSSRKKKKTKIESAPIAATENELFKEEFGDVAPSVNISKKKGNYDKKRRGEDEWFDYDKNYGFAEMFDDFKKYCKERGFMLSDNTVRETLCAIASSRIIVVNAEERIYQGYVALTSGYFGAKPYTDAVTPTFVKSNMLKNENDGAQSSSGFVAACMSAKNRAKTVFYMLKNVDFANASYLDEICDAASRSSKTELTGATGCVLGDNIRVFVRKGTGAIPDNISKVCAIVRPEIEFAKESAAKTVVKVPDYRQLVYVADMTVKPFAMSEDRWKKLDREEKEIAEYSQFEIDNKDWQRLEIYSSAFVAMSDLSDDKAESAYDSALDETVFAILSERMINACVDVKADDWSLVSSLERNFGDGVMTKTVREVKTAMSAKGGKDDD